MYKVFINDSSIRFGTVAGSSEKILPDSFLREPVKGVETIAAEDNAISYVYVSAEPQKSWTYFLEYFTLVEAAGGVVLNENGHILLIYRLGKWDLPKGKIETGESHVEGALREVVEECGIASPSIVKPLPTTYHYYALHNQHIVKPTYWYLMEVEGVPQLTPQAEEDITEVLWANEKQLENAKQNTYASIRGLLKSLNRGV